MRIERFFVLHILRPAPAFFLFLLLLCVPALSLAGSYPQYPAGSVVTIGEFVYNDDYSPTTDNCDVTVYDPTNTKVVYASTTARSDGWHSYTFTPASVLGVWSSNISCGSSAGGTLVRQDESFVVVSPPALQSDIQTASSSIAAVVNAHTDAATGNVTSGVNAHTDVASSSIGTMLLSIPLAVWNITASTLTTVVPTRIGSGR